MRVGLLIIAVLALIGFVVVAVVLPQKSEAEAKEAAQALVTGADHHLDVAASSRELEGIAQQVG